MAEFGFSISLILWTVVVLPLVYFFYNFIIFYADVRRRSKFIRKLPGIDPHPLWGHLHLFPGPNEAGLTWMRQAVAEMPRLSHMCYGPFFHAVAPIHPETLNAIYKTSEPKPLGSVGGYHLVAPWLGNGLLLAGGQKWARNRRLLTPAFHFDILKPYMDINNEAVEVFLNKMEKFAEKDEYVEVFSHISSLTLDIILRCAFSYESDCQLKGESDPYVKAVLELTNIVVYRMLRPWLYPKRIFYLTSKGRQFRKNCDFVHGVATDIIKKRKMALEENQNVVRTNARCLDFLDTLLTCRDEDNNGLSEQEIRDEVDTFLFEGHDTTASAISWTLYSLATHPEIQKKCQDEIDEILSGKNSDKIEWDDLPKLTYLTQCIKEGMRLHSPVPFIERLTTKDMEIDGYFIPKGTIIDINIYVLHHNPEIWKDSTDYQPDRFSPSNAQAMDSYAYTPFSAGPRNCIGQNFAMHEMKSVIARILRKYNIEADENRPAKHSIKVVMKTENGMYMKFLPRK